MELERFSFFKSNFGSFLCGGERESELKEFGSGMVLYFKLLKFLAFLMLVLSLISLPSFIFFHSERQGQEKDHSSIKHLATYFTLGNLGACKFFIFNSFTADFICDHTLPG